MIGLKITIIKGSTIDGRTEYFFDHTHSSIVLGCDPEVCHIAFIEKFRESGVGNEHLAFKRSLGRYQLDLNSDHYVSVDGDTPFEDQEVNGTATLCLGNEIVIAIEVIDQRLQPHLSGKKMAQPGTQVRRNTRLLWFSFVAGAGLLILVGFLGSGLLKFSSNLEVSEESIHRVVDDLKSLSLELSRVEQDSEIISQKTINRVSQSVYLVLVRNRDGAEVPAGTAWVVDESRLATNAHVAMIYERLKADEELIVRAPSSPYRSHVVSEVTLHPGYERFAELWREYLPCQKILNKLVPMKTVSPADVALLTVHRAEALNPPLPLASREELELIAPGMKVAYIGYPTEDLLPGNNKMPVPVTQQDEVIRVTDFFQTRVENGPNRLIQHGLPITGGASGSPMINAAGRVIGLISAMNISMSYSGRTPNAADVNFGQRIDFLYDLMNLNPRETLDRLERQWRQSMNQYLPGVSTSNRAVADNLIQLFSLTQAPAKETLHEVRTIEKEGSGPGLVTTRVRIKEPGLHLVTLNPEQTIKKFRTSASGQVNLSQYNHFVEYADFTNYALVIAEEPGELLVSFNTSKNEESDEIGYTIEVTSWAGKLNDLIETYLTYRLNLLTGPENPVKMLKRAENLPMVLEDKQNHLTGFEFELQQQGIYFFLSAPQGPGAVDVVLLDESGRKIGVDNSPNGIGSKVYEHAGGSKTIRFISFSKNPAVVQTMSVFFSEKK